MMSTESWNLENDLCRCCLKEGSFKNLAGPCKTLDSEEIYSDMLKNCFDIEMSPVPGMLFMPTYTICEACISRLRDATEFKIQVQNCEERFRDLYNRNVIKCKKKINLVEVVVKQEIPDTYQDDDYEDKFSPNDDEDDEDYVSVNFQINKEEPNSTSKSVLRSLLTSQRSPKEEVRSKKKKYKKTVKRKRMVQVKEVKVEKEEDDEEKKKSRIVPPKFHLRDEDYKVEGDIFKCKRCDKTYDKNSSLRYHVKTIHYQIPRYKCSICMKGFMNPSPLTVHKLEEHNIDDRFKCNACKGAFNSKVQLRKHINNFHMLGERHKCEFCDYETFSFEALYKHKFKHRTVKDYHCRFCRKSFLRKTTLDLHERIHTGDRRKVCSVCGQAFVQKASLNYHMTKYHPEVNF